MTSFIKEVLVDLNKKEVDFSELVFILPSKRAGTVLKKELSELVSATIFAPTIYSIENFVEALSDLKQIQNIELLFTFYDVYLKNTPKKEQETFDTFSKWAQTILQDFNEVDRYLIDSNYIFNYLNEIQKINHTHWSLNNNQTDLTKKYLAFWSKLHLYYNELSNVLINSGQGYQGLIYREAVENLENYIQANGDKQHVFLGFNALNKSESLIIQELLQHEIAEIYWDIDQVFADSKIHNAAYFINSHKSNWNYYKTNSFNWETNNYSNPKNITVLGASQDIGQAKLIGQLIKKQTENSTVNNTAIVLGDESLLIPVLNSLPEGISSLNITMGSPLKTIPMAALFNRLFKMHESGKSSFYYKDVVSVLLNENIRSLFQEDASKVVDHIQKNNIVHLSQSKLNTIAESSKDLISLLFSSWENNPEIAINNVLSLIKTIKQHLEVNKENALTLEYLFRFYEVFNTLQHLNTRYSSISSIKTLRGLYNEIVASETLDFSGEPLSGLQIMGMLESRVLDFETVIISSVNEGILPSGKTNNSFIPFDVKLENNLPTYKEKDAVYTYHFYRLIQRAKNIYIIYNTDFDTINGGEKSRFIPQLEIEDIHTIKHEIISPNIPKLDEDNIKISKDDDVISKLIVLAQKGFSPSSLTNYIRNPIDFYYQKILGIKEHDDVEENVAYNTLGTIIHNSLEDLYTNFIGNKITINDLTNMKPSIEKTVKKHFKKEFKEGDTTSGKNLIIYEIAKHYIIKFIDLEIADLKQENEIAIVSLEATVETSIVLPEISTPIKLYGKVDRVDTYNGITRIIDYKTGRVEQSKVEIANWEDITTDYTKYSKSFQVLMYTYIMFKEQQIQLPVEAGIFSFKNLNAGLLKFAKKEGGRNKTQLITESHLLAFEEELKKLILEIFNREVDFVEKEV